MRNERAARGGSVVRVDVRYVYRTSTRTPFFLRGSSTGDIPDRDKSTIDFTPFQV